MRVVYTRHSRWGSLLNQAPLTQVKSREILPGKGGEGVEGTFARVALCVQDKVRRVRTFRSGLSAKSLISSSGYISPISESMLGY